MKYCKNSYTIQSRFRHRDARPGISLARRRQHAPFINIPGILLALVLASCGNPQDLQENGKDTREADETRQVVDYDSYYLYREKKIPVQRMEGKYYAVFYAENEEKLKEELDKAGATLEYVRPLTYPVLQACVDTCQQMPDNEMPPEITRSAAGATGGKFINCKSATIEGEHEKIAIALSCTLYWAPYYKTENDTELGLTERFIVILKPGTTVSQLEELARANTVEMIGRDPFEDTPNWYHLSCTNLSNGNALEMANRFYESGLFESAFPDFIEKIVLD
ncbi:MAG: hypothetical protein LBF09_03055 [Odoribacteraceae bacterium]|jgi:hypothetical protein|nr:hypothetical protein [Odoribacteraceae bacterium]